MKHKYLLVYEQIEKRSDLQLRFSTGFQVLMFEVQHFTGNPCEIVLFSL